MRYSALTQRIAGEGAAAWRIHDRALELRAEGVDVLLLSVGDPDFDTPLPIIHGAIDSLLAGDTHYSEVRGRWSCASGSPSAIGDAAARTWTLTM